MQHTNTPTLHTILQVTLTLTLTLTLTPHSCTHITPTLHPSHSSHMHISHTQRGADGEEHIHVGKLNLVDLAGSERQSKTGSTVREKMTAL